MPSYADDAVLAAPTDLTALKAKAKQAMGIEDDIATRLELIGADKEKLRFILEDELPKLMATAGMTEFVVDGVTVKCGIKTFASLPNAENNPEAFAAGLKYLDTHGAASLAKRTIAILLNREKKGMANTLVKYLAKKYPDASVTIKVSVHHGTLTTWVKERLERGFDLPLETLGAYQKMIASIKRPKAQMDTNK